MKKTLERLFEKYHGLNMHPSVKNGLIVGILGIAAAIIIALATYFSGAKATQTTTAGNSGSIAIAGSTRDVNFIYQVSGDNVAKEAIKELDARIAETDGKVEMTRKELTLVSQALKDLDQRTSGIQKLPDGRTLFGKIVSGDPNIIIDAHNAAIQASDAGNPEESLRHSEIAIGAYEQAKEKVDTAHAMMTAGDLGGENIGKLYWLAANTAQQLKKNDLAYEFAKKTVQSNPSPINKALLATALFNLGKRKEALAMIQEAVDAEPNNPRILEIKNRILQAAEKQA